MIINNNSNSSWKMKEMKILSKKVKIPWDFNSCDNNTAIILAAAFDIWWP